jgi:hypothetical protein
LQIVLGGNTIAMTADSDGIKKQFELRLRLSDVLDNAAVDVVRDAVHKKKVLALLEPVQKHRNFAGLLEFYSDIQRSCERAGANTGRSTLLDIDALDAIALRLHQPSDIADARLTKRISRQN